MLAFVIPTRNRADLAARAAAALLYHDGRDISVVVSDNSTDDAQAEQLARFCRERDDPRLVYLRAPDLAMPAHWDWALEQTLARLDPTHVTVHYDRKLLRRGAVRALLDAILRHPGQVITYSIDHVPQATPPFSVYQVPWTGRAYRVSTAAVVRMASEGKINEMGHAFPILSNCVVPREVLDRIRARFGTICDSTGPDATFTFRFAAVEPGYVHLDRSLGLVYANARSNGAGYLSGRATDYDDFRRSWGERPWLDAAPIAGLDLGWNLLFHEYELVRETLGNGAFPPLSRQGYLEGLAFGLQYVEGEGRRAELEALLRQEGWRAPTAAPRPPLPLRAARRVRNVAAVLRRQWQVRVGLAALGIPPKHMIGFRRERDAVRWGLRFGRRRSSWHEYLDWIGRPVRVAQVCATTDGALWMVQIAAGLRRRGLDVVAIVGGAEGGTAAACRKAGVPFVALPEAEWQTAPSNPLRAARLAVAVWRMARLLRRLRVDAVHSHILWSSVVVRLAGALARVPVRVSHAVSPLQLEAPKLRRLDLATARLDHRVLAGCHHTEELYARFGVPASRHRTVGYGVDPAGFDPATADGGRVRRELGLDEDAVVVGQVAWFYGVLNGALAPPGMAGRGIKGHEDLVAAARIVLAERPGVRFLIVGDGFGEHGAAHFEAIRRLARDLGVEDGLVFAGRRPDLPDVLAALDVSVQCSLSENYGGTIESLLMERPVVATATGGMPETVVDGETGLLVPVMDPEALAAAIVRLVDDPALRRRLGEAGRERMLAGHTIGHTIDGVVDVYRELVDIPEVRADGAGSPGLVPADVLFTGSARP